ncbi:DEAD/DEAH box helicase family protein [Floccifex sp.]|uniref:DEAD/DEAH box helicase family protein n=1 Tax=Floccifex sp. TaxID=2815810 RepID=UPI003F0FAEF9
MTKKKFDVATVNKIVEKFERFVMKYKHKEPRKCQIAAIRAFYTGYYKHFHFLFNMCCGSGKTIIAAFLIFMEIVECNKNHKFARTMIASHRLLLNKQLVNIVNDALRSNKITNVKWFNLSSATIKINGIIAAPFKKTSIKTIMNCEEHVIIIACAASEKKHFKEMNTDTMENIFNELLEEKSQMIADNTKTKFLNLIIQDEIHKDIPAKILNNFASISEKVIGFSATPNKKIIEWFGNENIFEYWFCQALLDGIVVKGKLYIAKTKAKRLKNKEATYIIECFEHLKKECKTMRLIPVFLNYFSSVDNLMSYAKTINKKYGDTVDVAVFASYKEIIDEKNGKKTEIQCELNGNPMSKDELLEYCQKRDDNSKPLIILSAFMIVEGIDIPSINGVGIWCEKNDANMFQAACRGCRTDKDHPNKTHFYIYTSEDLATDTDDFLTKLYNGFNGQLDFGDGQDDCKGTGKNGDNSMKNTQDGFVVVPASAVKTMSAIIKEVKIAYQNNMQEINNEKDYKNIEKTVLKEATSNDAFCVMLQFVNAPGFDLNRLTDAIDKYYK